MVLPQKKSKGKFFFFFFFIPYKVTYHLFKSHIGEIWKFASVELVLQTSKHIKIWMLIIQTWKISGPQKPFEVFSIFVNFFCYVFYSKSSSPVHRHRPSPVREYISAVGGSTGLCQYKNPRLHIP